MNEKELKGQTKNIAVTVGKLCQKFQTIESITFISIKYLEVLPQ
jgi:hypothetical protein